MHTKSAVELHRLFLSGEASAREIAEHFLDRIERLNPKINAFLEVFKEEALQKADELDAKRKAGEKLGRLAAIPVAIKDIIHIKGKKTTCASKFLENYVAPYDATVTQLLKDEDALIIGKTNLDEFAMGSSNEHSSFGPVANPWNFACTPGGSSGGSAAAVAARMCLIALGTDTGGSIRQPAAFTGTVGFKPTYGRISRYGLVAFASSFDQIGPMTTCVEDAQLAMEVLGTHCPNDATSLPMPAESYCKATPLPLQGLKVGVAPDSLLQLKGEMKENYEQYLAYLKQQGAQLHEVNLDLLPYCTAVYYILATAEASTNLARFDGVRYGKRSEKAETLDQVYLLSKQEGYGSEVKRRIMLGTFVLSAGHKDAYYLKALKVRTLIKEQVRKAFQSCDAIFLPTTPTPAFKMGSIHDGVEMYLQDIYTHAANIAGLPAVSIPSGKNAEGLPLGMQLLGKACDDVNLLGIAKQLEESFSLQSEIPSTCS